MGEPDQRRDLPPRAGGPAGKDDSRGPAERAGRAAVPVALAGVFFTIVFPPVGLILDVAAIVLGVRALRVARAGRRSARAVWGIVLGSVGTVLAVCVITVLAVFWTEFNTYRECRSGANTIAAKEQCMANLREAIRERLGITVPER